MSVWNELREIPDLMNVGFGQLVIQSPFRIPVKAVVGIIPQEKVIRIHAWRIVAAMKYQFSFRYRTKVKIPGKTVSQHFNTVFSPKSTISVCIGKSGPDPAIVSLFDAQPKALQQWDSAAKNHLRHIGLRFSSVCLGLAAAFTAVGLILPKFGFRSTIFPEAVGAADG